MEVFADAFIETFESTTFQFLNPLDKIPDEDDGSGYFLGKCDFSGAINGSFSLIIHDNTVNEYLNFLFGDEPETVITDELKSDSVKELANVICGNMISKCVNAQASDYKIEKPQLTSLSRFSDFADHSLYTLFSDSFGKVCGFSFRLK